MFVRMNIKGFNVYNEIPEGWRVLKGATTAPKGYIMISNNKSWFTKERRVGIIKIGNVKKNLLQEIEDNLRKENLNE